MIKKLTAYFAETRIELKRVTWPSREETLRMTAAVVFISIVVAIFLGFLDILFQYLLEAFIL
ncbi:MAG: preprotein translocase subunit SecE [Candidatus Ryanbacteria bacterium CG10_big_fil_rev_8_21_14_0_10_43_42]|uniref:Protein translocase subunit SecE n=1 Tax=Candidatus Ryanbacteria bacterium CG10_big_fil_rev_8_21_14_0_10_43_42 TaxID=1974864 RepID=A0A2M8KYB1_9BACT|nr:MAG: preprotein translocase subunit SecE [Candidatus Ryanbacteria bacterium CG10_big_fil_rev_8_21_14_0_10_43_42]